MAQWKRVNISCMHPQQLLNSFPKALDYMLHDLVVDIDPHYAIQSKHPEGDSVSVVQSIQDSSSCQINFLSQCLYIIVHCYYYYYYLFTCICITSKHEYSYKYSFLWLCLTIAYTKDVTKAEKVLYLLRVHDSLSLILTLMFYIIFNIRYKPVAYLTSTQQ